MASPQPNGLPNGLRNKFLDGARTPGRLPSPQPTHLSVPGATQQNPSNHSLIVPEKGPGYVAPKFEGKARQREQVIEKLEEEADFIGENHVQNEVDWFYDALGIDDMYFQTESVEEITNNILSLFSAKVAAWARQDKKLEIRLDKEDTDHALYIDTSTPGVTNPAGPQYEQRIDHKYLSMKLGDPCYRVETFRALNPLPGNPDQQMRCYFVYKCDFANPNMPANETDLAKIGDKRFLTKATENTKAIYNEIMQRAIDRTGPVIEYFDMQGSREKRLVIAYKRGTALGLFSALSDLYHWYGLTSSRKYVEQFSNGMTIMSVYLRPVDAESPKHPPIESSIRQIIKETSLLYCIPQNVVSGHFASRKLSLQETIYAHCVWVFIGHFMNRLGSEYHALASLLDVDNTVHAELLSTLKKRLRAETFTAEYILEIINQYPDLIHALYLSFADAHYIKQDASDDFLPTLSYVRTRVDAVSDRQALKDMISTATLNEHHEAVMKFFLKFNKAVLKTNFYTPTKVALSFRLNPDFLPVEEYPQPLYGMFLVISSEFRGFHLRFRDIARGGIRIVPSKSKEQYTINMRGLFDENYNLANTQQRKNKDIPEGGSKGVILLDYHHQNKATDAFEKYIDSILDLLLPPNSPGIKDPIVDLHGKEEILFMGPDEGTADLVNWATEHARARGAPWWKSFFTGKKPEFGGIPHDTYGMTTLSVRQYVEGIYRKLNLDQTKVRKLQTGGPDGDLGSNEIKLGDEQYCAIVDGDGVLVDPNGLDREELRRLAHDRKRISAYDVSKLSNQGYRVLVEDSNVKLPDGEIVRNGMIFRNTFHLRRTPEYDVFVPCGGRPGAIDLGNVNKLIENGKCTIPYIVEGANLFITQDAKLRLEKAGCIFYKDASANKGGVTSSSLEVLASLAFDDEGFLANMCVGADGKKPQFYVDYVKNVQEIIKENARLEFEAIWREHEATKTPRSILSDRLSEAITRLQEDLQNTTMWDNVQLRRSVLQDGLPKTLLNKIGLDMIMQRVPESYLRAIFGSYLASRYVYEYGISPSPFGFYDFMSKRTAQIALENVKVNV